MTLPVGIHGLPAQPVFVGREAELVELSTLLRPAEAGNATVPVVISAVAGMAGVGKTAVAVRAAHGAVDAGWYAGGVLMIDMRGYDGPEHRVRPAAALASFLGALGIPGEQIPSGQDDRERLWRSVMADLGAGGRRTLIVVDNVWDADQVRPLLPGAGGHAVVVTSRNTLGGLEGARLLDLDTLPVGEAVDLVRQELSAADPRDTRVEDAGPAVRQLVEICSALPLALRIAAALLAEDPEQPVAELVSLLVDERRRLAELDYSENLSVRAAFDLSYAQLTSEQAELFRLLALNPTPEISTEAAGALAGLSIADTRRALSRLRRARMVQPATVRGRWRMHDLLRLYAAERVAHDPRQDPAVRRLIEHYQLSTHDANQDLDACAVRSSRSSRFADRQAALAWLDLERANLVAVVVLARDSGHDAEAVKLAQSLYWYLDLRKYWDEWISSHDAALVSARRLGDRIAEGSLLGNLGVAYTDTGELQEALRYYGEAMAVHEEQSDERGQARVLNNIGRAYVTVGRLDEAIELHKKCLDVFRALDDVNRVGTALNNLGSAYAKGGRHEEAIECFERCLRIRRERGDRKHEASCLENLGASYAAIGRSGESLENYNECLRVCREAGYRQLEGVCLTSLGDSYRRVGRFDDALSCLTQSVEIFELLGNRHFAGKARQSLTLLEVDRSSRT